MTESNAKNWRELCAAAVNEKDSEKLVSLVAQILQAFDEGDHAISPPGVCGEPEYEVRLAAE